MEIFRQITANNIELKDYPFLKELAMEAYLMENEDILKLDTENFAEVTLLDAEIALTRFIHHINNLNNDYSIENK